MSRFDENRNIGQPASEQQIIEVMTAQEQLINKLREEISTLQTQQAQKQLFTPSEILQQFRQLRCLDDNHNVVPFIKSVEAVLMMCPRDNAELMNLTMTIIANEKITGRAGRYIQELGDNITWTQIKTKLMEHYKPRTTYGDVFNKCRNIKVCNLRELFTYFEKCKHELNEIYLFDTNKPLIYKPDRVDRDLVNILIEKIDIPLRSHLDQTSSLNDIITRYSQIRALDDPRAIHIKYRKNINNFNNTSTNTPTTSNTQRQNYTNRYTEQRQYTNTLQNQQNNQNYEPTQIFKKDFNNYQYRRDNNTYQTRNTNRSTESQNYRQAPEPMDIGTLQEEQLSQNNDINFIIPPQNQHYP